MHRCPLSNLLHGESLGFEIHPLNREQAHPLEYLWEGLRRELRLSTNPVVLRRQSQHPLGL